MPLTPQAAEDALRTSQAAFEAASANLDRARSLARSDGPRPFGGYPSVTDAQVAYDTALATRNTDRANLVEAQSQDARRPGAMADLAAVYNRPGGR